jgi:hypothetical protein
LRHTIFTGTPAATTILSENFDAAPPGTCLDVGGGPVCGVSVDNLVLRSVRATAAPVATAGN